MSGRYFLFLLFGVCGFLTLNMHSKSKFNNYHSVNWADAAGYYVYLPATFIYNYDAKQFPDSIESTTGGGFHLDLQNGKVLTRYNYGVALLQMPFFMTAHLVAPLFGYERDGYNPVYYRSVLFAGIFYLILGLFFLKKVFITYLNEWLAMLVLLLLFASTNLYYYAIVMSGFSHIYSFFLFSLFIFLTQKYYRSFSNSSLVLLAIVFTVAVLCRLTNGLIILYFIFYNWNSFKERSSQLFSLKVIGAFATAFILFFIPQILYWKYASGAAFTDMYGEGQSFSHLTSPRIKELLFSTDNGWLLYTPIALLMLVALVYRCFKKDVESLSIALIIVTAVYLFASWFSWDFGCSYGSRPFVEYYALLILPSARVIGEMNRNQRYIVLAIAALFGIFNINTIYHYDGCWYGGIWDWNEYFRIILR
jgi:hypothetical protein